MNHIAIAMHQITMIVVKLRMQMDDERRRITVDEWCLDLADRCLNEEKWTAQDRVLLAHALQQTVMDFIETFGGVGGEKANE